MSSARARILSSIRSALGHTEDALPGDHDAIARDAAALVANPAVYQPAFDEQSTRVRFIERVTSERLTASVDEVAVLADVPAAVGRYLQKVGLRAEIAIAPDPAITELNWDGIACHTNLDPHEPIAVNRADFGIAETGSIVFASSTNSPTLFNFLPLHHVVVLSGASILRFPEQYWSRIRADGGVRSRGIHFVTGTSGTADIEAKNVRGAHGPRFMHIVIFDK